MKTDATLKQRLAHLEKQGIDLTNRGDAVTVTQLALQVGDLTLAELMRMVLLDRGAKRGGSLRTRTVKKSPAALEHAEEPIRVMVAKSEPGPKPKPVPLNVTITSNEQALAEAEERRKAQEEKDRETRGVMGRQHARLLAYRAELAQRAEEERKAAEARQVSKPWVGHMPQRPTEPSGCEVELVEDDPTPTDGEG